MRLASFVVFGLLVGSLGCGSSDGAGGGAHALATRGDPNAQRRGTFEDDVLVVDLSANGKQGHVLVDTGSPMNFLSPTKFGVASGSSNLELDVGDFALVGVPVLGDEVGGGAIDGILGGGTICQFATTFDYRTGSISFGTPPSGGTTTTINVPFDLGGGGQGLLPTGDIVSFGPTRIVTTATIEGVDYTVMVDTGASFVVVRDAIHDVLVKDGRKEVPIDVTLASGATSAKAFRTKSIVVGGAEVVGAPATSAGGAETLLDSLSNELHRSIYGVVGGTFLREFRTTIDYPARLLRLARYDDRSHIHDAFQRIGVELNGEGARYVVKEVFDGSDAKTKGIVVGDAIVSVDATPLAPLDPLAADALLRAPPASSHTVEVQRADGSSATITVLSDDLLPLP